jgi:hypothetical protein
LCDAGQFVNTVNTTGCTPCKQGQNQVAVGQAKCNDCPSGSVTNTYNNPGAKSCTPCKAGQYTLRSTQNCQPCKPLLLFKYSPTEYPCDFCPQVHRGLSTFLLLRNFSSFLRLLCSATSATAGFIHAASSAASHAPAPWGTTFPFSALSWREVYHHDHGGDDDHSTARSPTTHDTRHTYANN